MCRLELLVLAVLAVGGFADPFKYVAPSKVADKVFLKKQMDLLGLYYHIHEPLHEPEMITISQTWSLEQNMELYNNMTAVKIYCDLMKHGRLLPLGVPFTIFERKQRFEATTLFNVFFSAKNYDTFYKTAVYMRSRVNEYLYVYVLSIAILNHPETQGIILPPIYEVFPSFFNNGQIMTTAQRLNVHGKQMIEHYPGTFLWEDSIVINWNYTVWPYYNEDFKLSYFTNDYFQNAVYYNNHLCTPFWLSGASGPMARLKRGEYYWFIHKQVVTRYYMERLSNGLGEIPELDYDVVQQGYSSGLLYHNGIPFPTRPNHFNLDQSIFRDNIFKLKTIESRIQNAIDLGYVIDSSGKQISIRKSDAIDMFGSLIEGNVDSPNVQFYSHFVGLWKYLLGNSMTSSYQYINGHVPLVLPSVLQHYETNMRDPAFYMIWKRALKFFNEWSAYLPFYKYEELAIPTVKIEKVEVDKLVTYFENVYLNITNHLHMNEEERKAMVDDVKVLVQHPVINHKPFNIRLYVKSDVAKKVTVRFFLAPKYDSKGIEIPLHINTHNFFQFDQFTYELPAGECVINRESNQNMYMTDKWTPATQIFEKAMNAYNGNGEFVVDEKEFFVGYPRRLMIPKGRVGGMPFVFMAYIGEYMAPQDPYGTGSNPPNNYGVGTGSRRMTGHPMNFPLDRPLYKWQTDNVNNMYFEEVNIYHKPIPEMYNPFL